MPLAPAIVLLSGGMDSVTALYHAHSTGAVSVAVSFDYGSKHNAREISYASWHCEALGIRHEVIHLDFFTRIFQSSLLQGGAAIPDGHYAEENMKQTVVPFRNGIMLAIAAGIAENEGAGRLVIRGSCWRTMRFIQIVGRASCKEWRRPCVRAPMRR